MIFFAAFCVVSTSVFALFTLNINNTGNIIKSAQSPIRLEVSDSADMADARSLNAPYPALFVQGDVLASGGMVIKYISVQSVSAEDMYYRINLSARGTDFLDDLLFVFSAEDGGSVLTSEIRGAVINSTSSQLYGHLTDGGEKHIYMVGFSLRDRFSLPPGSNLTVDIELIAQNYATSYKYVDGGQVYQNNAAITELFMPSSLYVSDSYLFVIFGFSAQWNTGNRPAVLKKIHIQSGQEESVLLTHNTTYGIDTRIAYLHRRKILMALAGKLNNAEGEYLQPLTMLTTGTLTRDPWNILLPLPLTASGARLVAATSAYDSTKDYVYAVYGGEDIAANVIVRLSDNGSRDMTFMGTGQIKAEDMQGVNRFLGAAANGHMLYISALMADGKSAIITVDTISFNVGFANAPLSGTLCIADEHLVLTTSGRAQLLAIDGTSIAQGFEPSVFAGKDIVESYFANDGIYFLTAKGDVYRAIKQY